MFPSERTRISTVGPRLSFLEMTNLFLLSTLGFFCFFSYHVLGMSIFSFLWRRVAPIFWTFRWCPNKSFVEVDRIHQRDARPFFPRDHDIMSNNITCYPLNEESPSEASHNLQFWNIRRRGNTFLSTNRFIFNLLDFSWGGGGGGLTSMTWQTQCIGCIQSRT